MRVHPFSLVLVLTLVGCAGLPPAGTAPVNYVAVYYESGDSFPGSSFYVETWNTTEPFRLHSGLNFIPVPADATEEMVTNYFADASSRGNTYRLATKQVYRRVKIPGADSIVLVPLVLGNSVSRSSNGQELRMEVTPMPAAKADAMLLEWSKDKNALSWKHLVVDAP